MSNNDQSVVVVESSGFSDKKIKLESLKNADGISVNGDDISNYLSSSFIADIPTQLEQEKRQDIGICRKPYLRYPKHKEPNGQGEVFDRAKINRLYVRSTMKNLNKRNANKIEYVLTAFLTGKTFTFQQLSDYIKEKSGKEFGSTPLNNVFLTIKKSKILFMFKRIGGYPQVWALDSRATQIKLDDLYELFKKKGNLTLEDACLKYPFITSIIKENGGPKISLPTPTIEDDIIDPNEPIDKFNEAYLRPYNHEDSQPARQDPMQALEKLAQALSKNDGKIDLNINVNFKISFGN